MPASAVEPIRDGFPRMRRKGASIVFTPFDQAGVLLGPLYDPRIVKADDSGLLLLGIERIGAAAHVQEWAVQNCERDPLTLD